MTTKAPLTTLQKFLDIEEPTLEQAIEVFTPLTVGEYDDIHIAALLTHIRTRGETFADVAGAARAFLRAGRPFPCLLYTSPSPRDRQKSRMPSSA